MESKINSKQKYKISPNAISLQTSKNLNFQQLPVKFQDNFPRENKTTV